MLHCMQYYSRYCITSRASTSETDPGPDPDRSIAIDRFPTR